MMDSGFQGFSVEFALGYHLEGCAVAIRILRYFTKLSLDEKIVFSECLVKQGT